MPTRLLHFLLIATCLAACATVASTQPLRVNPAETATSIVVSESPTPEVTSTAVDTSSVSYKVGAFYYPWYGTPEIDGQWIHWAQNNHVPPDDIASDYFPALGAYSSNDPNVVTQHMKWLQQAGVGVIITSWWGQASREDEAVPLLLQTAETYGLKVAFHIEPYNGRTPQSLVSDIQYIYREYGNSPAFFRSTAASRYSSADQPRGMFFVWSIQQTGNDFSFWQEALDQIHALPEGALVVANSLDAGWIEGSHFDGLYNYATLHLEEQNGFDWARSLPPDSLYIPSVIPGFSARRVGYADTTYVPRNNGETYATQWGQALGTGVEPAMVTITSFNEWHEGSMIEPPKSEMSDGNGYTYSDFESLPAEGYLERTHDWIEKYLGMTWPSAVRAQIRIATTSDWTTVNTVSGGAWLQPELISSSASALNAGLEAGDRFLLTQSLEDANAGKEVEMTWNIMLTQLEAGQDLVLQIDRGNIGKTTLTIYNALGSTPVEVKNFVSDQVTTGRNSVQVRIPAELLIHATP